MRTEQFYRTLLSVAFLVLGAAILVAYFNPATSYELSIYAGTPIAVWIGICFSLFIALVLSFTSNGYNQRVAWFLAGTSFLVITMLPLIRGYYHLGEGDTMSHIGIVRDLATGVLNPLNLSYPGVHLISLFTKEILAVPITQSFYYTTYSFVILFMVFVPLSVRLILSDRLSMSISLFAAILLLPVNLISVHMNVHPTSQAILFMGLLIYIFITYVENNDHRYMFILPVVSLAILMLHPQQAANFLLLLGVAGVVQLIPVMRKGVVPGKIRAVHVQTSIFFIMFWVWFRSSGFVQDFSRFVVSLLTFSQEVAGEVDQRSGSLTELGSGPEELFVKLFLVSIIFCLMAGVYMAILLLNTFLLEKETDNDAVLYLTFGLFPISILFFLYIIANVTTQYFRHLGFIMVLITIIGVVGLRKFIDSLLPSKRTAKTAIVIIFIAFLSLSLLVVYPSPYIYQETGHVPKAQVNGYETAFNHYDEGTEFLFLRSATDRYADFHSEGGTTSPTAVVAPDHFADQNLANHYEESKYVTVTANDRRLGLEVYNGLRYSQEDFQYLDTDPTVSRVQSSGNFDLYLVTVDDQTDRESGSQASEAETQERRSNV